LVVSSAECVMISSGTERISSAAIPERGDGAGNFASQHARNFLVFSGQQVRGNTVQKDSQR